MAIDQIARHPYASYGAYTRTDLPGATYEQPNTRGVGKLNLPYGSTFVNNKDWKVKVAREIDASAPFEKVEMSYRSPRFSFLNAWGFVDTGKKHRFHSYATLRDFYDPTAHLVAMSPSYYQEDLALRDLALKRLKTKLQQRTSQYNVLIPLVELRELRGLLRTLVFSLVDIIRMLISLKKSKGRAAYQYASHAWLTWSFAIKPTLADIQDAAAAVEAFMAQNSDKITDYGAAKKLWHTTDKKTGGQPFGVFSTAIVGQFYHELSYRYVAGYRPKVMSANNYGVGRQFGLEFGAMVPAFWELTPFSWVADYFSTMGDYLEDTFVSESVNTIYCNLTRRYRVKALLNYTYVLSPSTVSAITTCTPGTFRLTQKKRSVLGNIPTRSLRFKSTDEISKGALNKLLNLTSVLVGSGKYFKPI